MKVAVTGGTGFLGRAIAGELSAAGHQVVAIARGLTAVPEGLELRRADLEDESSWNGAFDGCEAVVHAAAGIRYWRRDWSWLERVNVTGTRIVCAEARRARVRRLVHVSSVSAIGDSPDGTPLDESSPFTASRWRIGYFETKRKAEDEVRHAVERGLDATLVCPGAIFGPSDVQSNLNDFLQALAAGRMPFTPPGSLSLVDLESVAQGIGLALERGRTGERYLLTSANVSFEELLEAVARCAGRRRWRPKLPAASLWLLRGLAVALDAVRPRPPFTREALAALSMKMVFTSERARSELGWTPRPWLEALQETIRWAVAGPAQTTKC